MMISLRKSLRLQSSKAVLLVLLLILVVIGAAPGYLSGKWRWSEPPKVATLSQLTKLHQVGLQIPGWQVIDRKTPQVGEHKWLMQEISNANKDKAIVLLFPQKGNREQPEVEWSDVSGFQNWETDSDRSVDFTVKNPATKVTAQFFRGLTKRQQGSSQETRRQTYAVLQWYAWSTGGHPAPSQWFFADRAAQWQNRRIPWVAVSILVPIEPLDTIEQHWSEVESLAQTIQSTLMSSVLHP
jgi:cyanoexosortase B-associated protein